jgi:hypothetical protein
MNTTLLIVLLVAAIVIVAGVAWWAGQRRRSERLRTRFGSEYDRTVETAGKRSAAEADLEARQERVEALEIRALDPAERDRYSERWRVVQALFVDDPASAVGDADTLIGDVMRARGYPVGDFEQRAADVSVNHPQVVDHYRTAHAIATRQRSGTADTEQLRQAMVHYRALFADLLDLPDREGLTSTSEAGGAETVTRPATAATSEGATAAPTDAAASEGPASAPTRTAQPRASDASGRDPVTTTSETEGQR